MPNPVSSRFAGNLCVVTARVDPPRLYRGASLDPRSASAPTESYRVRVEAGECLSREALEARVRERVARLQSRGLQPGQVVLCPDAPALDLLLMSRALPRLGAALFAYRSGLDQAACQELAVATGTEWHWDPESAELVSTGIQAAALDSQPSPLCALVKTSGSSGKPKVVMLSHENLKASAALVNQRLGFGADDVWLCCLRLSHIGGLAILHRCALAGATLVLHEGFDAQRLADDLHRHAVTHVSLVPPMLARLLDVGVAPPPALRVLLIGGQALGETLAERALAAGWPLYLTYGMTETTSQIATSAGALRHLEDLGRVGPLLPDVDIDTGGRSTTSPGRLRVRGPMLMLGYANAQRLPGQGLVDGWFETSDLGVLDRPGGEDGNDHGELSILGRADEVLVIGGTNVSLVGVEAALRRAPGVAEFMLVALDDPVWGHRLVMVYRGDLDETALAHWCAQALAGVERPRGFKRVPAFPLLDSGKYDRVAIRALAHAASAGQ